MCHPPTLRVIEFVVVLITAGYCLLQCPMRPTVAPYDVSAISNVMPAAPWAIPGEAAKAGAGLLFFAYGSDPYTLSHFLGEAAHAAQSFKRHNPDLQIAVVTNNASVDRVLFSHVIVPRPDLLFLGSRCPYEKDLAKAALCSTYQTRRQWATRLYYMALSPFALTWALDSNVVSCTPGAAAQFLAAAQASPPLWGLDIAHANGGGGNFFPHNWNIAFTWNPRTSTLFRDWFMLQLRRGIAADDQHTLFAAEQRARAASGLRVGQMPTAYAAAFLSVKPGHFLPRLTRPLQSAAHVLHCKQPDCTAWCKAFARADEAARRKGALQPWQLYIPWSAYNELKTPIPKPLFSAEKCAVALSRAGVRPNGSGQLPECNFRTADGDQAASERAFSPTGLEKLSSLRAYMSNLKW